MSDERLIDRYLAPGKRELADAKYPGLSGLLQVVNFSFTYIFPAKSKQTLTYFGIIE